MRALLVAVLLLQAGLASGGEIVSGVAAGHGAERCAAFAGGVVSAGDVVTLVGAEPRVWSAVVTVVREIGPCAVLEDVEIEGPYYEVSAPVGRENDSWVALAVPGKPSLRAAAGGFTAELDGRPPREHLHVCASHEGLHLQIWSGAPFKGERRAEWYVYLGYDVDPTCADVVEADARERLKKE